jgi:GNAT superfamily N-acetyltransferase
MPVIRPMTEADVFAALELTNATFADLERRLGEEPTPFPDPAMATIRYRDLVRRDPGGSWVAEDEHGLAGCALALLREGIWGLSLLVVRPGLQSGGVGSELLRRAHEYGADARGKIILSSPDARAMRAYHRLGLTLHPAVMATGEPRDVRAPDDVQEGDAGDVQFTAEVDRHVRGGAHGDDVLTQLAMGQTLLIAPGRGYAVHGNGALRMLAAFEPDGASDLLRAVFARATGAVTVNYMTAAQQWAIDVCMEAKLDVQVATGVVFLGGDVGTFSPYIPSGAFL